MWIFVASPPLLPPLAFSLVFALPGSIRVFDVVKAASMKMCYKNLRVNARS